jgi:hypothetical protein
MPHQIISYREQVAGAGGMASRLLYDRDGRGWRPWTKKAVAMHRRRIGTIVEDFP